MMIDLAEHFEKGYIALKDVAERQSIPKKYLEQIVTVFTKSELLKTIRGSKGGYMLANTPDKYTLNMILRLTEGTISPLSVKGQNTAGHEKDNECDLMTLYIWQDLHKIINDYLDKITLQDVIDKYRKEQAGFNYVI